MLNSIKKVVPFCNRISNMVVEDLLMSENEWASDKEVERGRE
jgi:hypothetical protein